MTVVPLIDADKFRVNHPDKLNELYEWKNAVTNPVVTAFLHIHQQKIRNDACLPGVWLFSCQPVPAGNAVSSGSRICREGRQTVHPRNCFQADGWLRLPCKVLHNSS